MLKTRLWMGGLLLVLAALILLEGIWFAPWYPVLGICTLLAMIFAGRELRLMIPPTERPDPVCLYSGIAALIISQWLIPVQREWKIAENLTVWQCTQLMLALWIILIFAHEMWRFQGPDRILNRLALTFLGILYLGFLPSFFLQLRWLKMPPSDDQTLGIFAIALAIFVPKFGDIGAYFTGKFLTGNWLGHHLMTPKLSPKKTWQGACGGLLASILTALLITRLEPRLIRWDWLVGSILMGMTIGIAGMLGDLAESLIKRDSEIKDASKSIPGFGGILDVVDSLLFAAPVVTVWLLI